MAWALPAALLGVVAGILAAERLSPPAPLLAAATVQALLLGALCPGRPRARTSACALALALLAAHGMARQLERARWPGAPRVLEATVEARVAAVLPRGGDLAVDLVGLHRVDGEAAALPASVRVFVEALAPALLPGELPDVAAPTAWVVGDRVRARLVLRPVVGRRNPGSPDREAALHRAGIGALARLPHPALQVRFTASPWSEARRALARARGRAAQRLRGAGAPLAAALALGDRAGLATGDREALRSLGLAHVLAVSGLHVGLVAGLAFAALLFVVLRLPPARGGGDPRRVALAGALVAALTYAPLCGFGLPVQRALVLLAGAALAFSARRRVAPLRALAVAALVILLREPAALFDVGAQLSFVATAALLASAAPPRALGGLATAATAWAATAPLAAFHFGRVAPFAVLANLVAVPVLAAAVLPASLVAAAVALVGAEGPLAQGVLAAVGGLEGLALAAVRAAANALPAGPGRIAPPPRAVVAAVLAGWLALRLRGPLLRSAAAVLVVALLARCPAAPRLPPAPRVVFLDVGAGDATVIQGRRGAVLVDGGASLPGGGDLGASVVLPALAALGIDALDLVVASHADLDHRGGLAAVVAALPVRRLWLPRGAARDARFEELAARARRAGARVVERGRGDAPLRVGDLVVTPLWPPPSSGAARADNDRSLVVRVDAAGTRVLLAGDVEAGAERALLGAGAELRAEVLKLAHHGSRSSSTRAFLDAVAPELAVASAACHRRHPTPHPEVARRVRARASLWWTGRDGAVWVGLAAPRVAVGERGGAPAACPPVDGQDPAGA